MGSISNNQSNRPVVCVFCGASPGNTPAHIEAGRALAQQFHAYGIKLVFGGGTIGVMGEMAKELVRLSGSDSVHGVIPKALVRFERNYTDEGDSNDDMEAQKKVDEEVYGRTTLVADMHTRKQLMAREVLAGGPGSGFVALSGGYGTLEELMEIVTWNQLGIHDKPVILFNVEGYWDGLLQWVKKALATDFVRAKNATIMAEAHSAVDVMMRLRSYEIAEGRLNLDWESETSGLNI